MGPLVPNVARGLVEASYADSTWARHASAVKCLEHFESLRGYSISWPVKLETLCEFVSWALLEKGLNQTRLKRTLVL
jgi:hypothetical protein